MTALSTRQRCRYVFPTTGEICECPLTVDGKAHHPGPYCGLHRAAVCLDIARRLAQYDGTNGLANLIDEARIVFGLEVKS